MEEEKYMRRDCIDAVQAFLEKAEALPYVSVGIEGQYISDRNEYRDKSKKEGKTTQDRGTQLCFMFGGGDRDKTTYAFRLKDFSAPENRNAKSTRFANDSGKPAVIVSESGPVSGSDGVKEDAGRARDMYRNTCMAANSLSFGAMFYDWSKFIYSGTKEYAKGRQMDADQKADGWGAVRASLDSPDGLKAMAAWGTMAEALDKAGVTPEHEKYGQLVATASKAMGLDELYSSLEKINGRMAADPDYKPDMAEFMNPDTDSGRIALRGLMCLSAYKQVKDRGGMDLRDSKGDPVVGVSKANMAVFDRLVYARSDTEAKRKALEDAEEKRSGICPVHCVQKTFAGIKSEDGVKLPDLRAHEKYRLTRAALLNEDPDMPSGAPAFTLEMSPRGSLSKPKGEDILVSSPMLATQRMPLYLLLNEGIDDPESRPGQLLAQMPVMKYVAGKASGTEKLEDMAIKQLQASKGESIDGMCLEMAAFQNKSLNKGVMSSTGASGYTPAQVCEMFQANARKTLEPAPNLIRSIHGAVGRPDFKSGQMALGDQYVADLRRSGLDVSEIRMGSNSTAASAAKAFRTMDKQRAAFVEAAAGNLEEAPETMAEAEAAFPDNFSAGTYKALLAEYEAEGASNPDRGAMMLNDFIVLTECYGINKTNDLKALGEDIRDVYSGTCTEETIGLYRPVDAGEHAALKQLYIAGDVDPSRACVPMALQGTEEGLLTVIEAGRQESEGIFNLASNRKNGRPIERAQEKFVQTAADTDTFDDHKNWDMAYQIDEPKRSKLAAEAERQAARTDGRTDGPDGDRSILD